MIFYHEDDYRQQEILPLAALDFCGKQVDEIDDFSTAHAAPDGKGWSEIFVRGKPPRELPDLGIGHDTLSDILQERLYAVEWYTAETLATKQPKTFFASVTQADEAREQCVIEYVSTRLAEWQAEGLVPDMAIEKGEETTRLGRERGWTHWHQLFNPRQLLQFALWKKHNRDEPGELLRHRGQKGCAR